MSENCEKWPLGFPKPQVDVTRFIYYLCLVCLFDTAEKEEKASVPQCNINIHIQHMGKKGMNGSWFRANGYIVRQKKTKQKVGSFYKSIST